MIEPVCLEVCLPYFNTTTTPGFKCSGVNCIVTDHISDYLGHNITRNNGTKNNASVFIMDGEPAHTTTSTIASTTTTTTTTQNDCPGSSVTSPVTTTDTSDMPTPGSDDGDADTTKPTEESIPRATTIFNTFLNTTFGYDDNGNKDGDDGAGNGGTNNGDQNGEYNDEDILSMPMPTSAVVAGVSMNKDYPESNGTSSKTISHGKGKRSTVSNRRTKETPRWVAATDNTPKNTTNLSGSCVTDTDAIDKPTSGVHNDGTVLTQKVPQDTVAIIRNINNSVDHRPSTGLINREFRFKPHQRNVLEKFFKFYPYVRREEIEQLSKILNVTKDQVKRWFERERRKAKLAGFAVAKE